MQDFAWLLVTPFVNFCSLVFAQQANGLFRDAGLECERLKRSNDGVSSEKRSVPGLASREELFTIQRTLQYSQV